MEICKLSKAECSCLYSFSPGWTRGAQNSLPAQHFDLRPLALCLQGSVRTPSVIKLGPAKKQRPREGKQRQETNEHLVTCNPLSAWASSPKKKEAILEGWRQALLNTETSATGTLPEVRPDYTGLKVKPMWSLRHKNVPQRRCLRYCSLWEAWWDSQRQDNSGLSKQAKLFNLLAGFVPVHEWRKRVLSGSAPGPLLDQKGFP